MTKTRREKSLIERITDIDTNTHSPIVKELIVINEMRIPNIRIHLEDVMKRLEV